MPFNGKDFQAFRNLKLSGMWKDLLNLSRRMLVDVHNVCHSLSFHSQAIVQYDMMQMSDIHLRKYIHTQKTQFHGTTAPKLVFSVRVRVFVNCRCVVVVAHHVITSTYECSTNLFASEIVSKFLPFRFRHTLHPYSCSSSNILSNLLPVIWMKWVCIMCNFIVVGDKLMVFGELDRTQVKCACVVSSALIPMKAECMYAFCPRRSVAFHVD